MKHSQYHMVFERDRVIFMGSSEHRLVLCDYDHLHFIDKDKILLGIERWQDKNTYEIFEIQKYI